MPWSRPICVSEIDELLLQRVDEERDDLPVDVGQRVADREYEQGVPRGPAAG